MASRLDTYEKVEAYTPDAWRAWLAAHHERDESIWLIRYRKGHPRYLSYDEVVEEALCWGWIDGLINKLDEERSILLISPRKPGSTWSRLNKDRLIDLFADDRMQDPGLIVLERAVQDGSWTMLDDIDALIEPDDLRKALDTTPGARAGYEALSPSSKKQLLWALKSAKREPTRQARLKKGVDAARQGKAAF
jgi:uncharacterized protein YdeI (YjbR/CyaY-like superfamily)